MLSGDNIPEFEKSADQTSTRKVREGVRCKIKGATYDYGKLAEFAIQSLYRICNPLRRFNEKVQPFSGFNTFVLLFCRNPGACSF